MPRRRRVTPFAALSSADATRYGVANAVFVGQPKDFKDAYLPQCGIWIPPQAETVALAGYAGRVFAEFEAKIAVFADLRADWYAAEQQILAIRDALWPVLLRHGRLGGAVSSVIESEARPGRGLCYETVAGSDYPAASRPSGGSASSSPSAVAASCRVIRRTATSYRVASSLVPPASYRTCSRRSEARLAHPPPPTGCHEQPIFRSRC